MTLKTPYNYNKTLLKLRFPTTLKKQPKLTHNLAQAASHDNIETHSRKLAQHIE